MGKLHLYVKKKKFSPYFLEYAFFIWFWFILIAGLGLLFILVKAILRIDVQAYNNLIYWILILLATGFLIFYFIFIDRTGWLYVFDKRKKAITSMQGELWDFKFEETMSYSSDFNNELPSKIHFFFDSSLCALRMRVYYRGEKEKVSLCGRFGSEDRAITNKDGQNLKYVRMIYTIPKNDMFEHFLEIYPDAKVEMVFWKRSRILIEFRPVEGVEYPPEALEYLEQINAMYP